MDYFYKFKECENLLIFIRCLLFVIFKFLLYATAFLIWQTSVTEVQLTLRGTTTTSTTTTSTCTTHSNSTSVQIMTYGYLFIKSICLKIKSNTFYSAIGTIISNNKAQQPYRNSDNEKWECFWSNKSPWWHSKNW